MQQNKTPKPNQSLLLKSSSRMGTVFLCKYRNGKKKKRLSWQMVVGKRRYGWILEAEAAKSVRSGSHPWSSAHTFIFLCIGWMALGRAAKRTCFPASSLTSANKLFGGKKSSAWVQLWIYRSIPTWSWEARCYYSDLSNPGDAYNSQHLYSAAKEQTLLHQMQIASVWQVPGPSKISLLGAWNDFFILIEI